MMKLALGTLSICVIAACGGGKTQLLDSGVDAFMLCSPSAQTGCLAGEKCTWIIDIDAANGMNPIGHIGCVPNGTVDAGDCMFAKAGVTNGADQCVAGQLCLSGKCKRICDPQVEGAAAGACPMDFACARIDGILESSGDAVAGICESACDPLTQKLKVGTTNLEACGSANAAMPSRTCVPGGRTVFSCADNVSESTDRQPPFMRGTTTFSNSCAPGYVVGFAEASGSMNFLCAGLCSPLEVDDMIVKVAGHGKDNQGDAAALGKLPTDPAPVKGHATCAAGVKGALTDINSPLGEDCRFLWSVTRPEDLIPTNPYNDTLGLCLAFEKFTVMTPTGAVPAKSCAEFPRTLPPDSMDPFGTAQENGCYKFGKTLPGQTVRKNVRRMANFRLAFGEASLARHIFE